MPFLENLNWRYATKRFDSSKKVSEENKNKILEAIRMAPTSFGFQPFQAHIIENTDIREELKKAARGQIQLTDASFVLVFSARSDMENKIDEYIELVKADFPEKVEYLLKKKDVFKTQSVEEKVAWTAKQAYIALGFGLAACAELGIDSCPMEGFNKDEFKKILKLSDNLYPQAIFAVGYRLDSETPKKIRFSKEDLFTIV